MNSLTDPFPAIDQLPQLRLTGGSNVGSAVSHAGNHAVAPRSAERDGHAEGLLRGYDEGRRAAIAEVRNDLSFALTALHGAIEDLHRRDEAGLATLASETVDLALAIAEIVIGREIDAAIDPGRDALVRALSLAPDRGDIVARLHPADLDQIGDLTTLVGSRNVELIADHGVERGGCLVDVGPARVNAQISAALERVRAELTNVELHHDLVDGQHDGHHDGTVLR